MLDAMITIRNEFPDAKFIIFTTYTGDAQVLRAINRTPSCRYNVTGVVMSPWPTAELEGMNGSLVLDKANVFRLFVVAFVGHKHCLQT